MASSVMSIVRALGFSVAVTLSITACTGEGHAAPVATAEQRAACTPDAFRLCSSEIPNISAITACMRKNKSSLSSACKAVFDK